MVVVADKGKSRRVVAVSVHFVVNRLMPLFNMRRFSATEVLPMNVTVFKVTCIAQAVTLRRASWSASFMVGEADPLKEKVDVNVRMGEF